MERNGVVLPDEWVPPESIEFIGMDSNAGAIMGTVRLALRKAGNPPSVLDEYIRQAMSGDYDNLLRVSMVFADYKGPDE